MESLRDLIYNKIEDPLADELNDKRIAYHNMTYSSFYLLQEKVETGLY